MRVALLSLRYLLALFFAGAAVNKWKQGYITSDHLQGVFFQRIEEIDPESFGAWFIENIGIPHYVPLAWLVCWGETLIALGLLFGCMTRGAAAGASRPRRGDRGPAGGERFRPIAGAAAEEAQARPARPARLAGRRADA